MNYYPHHIGDYTKDTAHLSVLEDGAYRRLLDLYYSTERPLPLDRAMLYRLTRAREKTEREAVDIVLTEFFQERSDGWHQERCDAEIAKMQEKSGKAKASAAIRWQSGRNPNASDSHDKSHSERITERIPPSTTDGTPKAMLPITNNQEPIANSQKNSKATAPDASRRPPKIAFDFSEGAFKGITEEQELRWQEAYPAVPIPPAIAQAAAWVKANPANKKSNYERFLVNWFSRAQEKAPRVRQ